MKMFGKMKCFLVSVLASATAIMAQTNVSSVVASSATTAQTEFEAIISSIAPVVFVIVVASVAITLGIRLFRKA